MKWLNENAWDDVIAASSRRYNVPMALIKAIIGQESKFNPAALRGEAKIGDSSIGLMQILLSTARGEGFSGTAGTQSPLTGLFDPATNITFGTSYLSKCIARTGDISGAVSMYNGGYRPELGFGARALKAVTVCLRRDSTGKCVETRSVKAGEFGNQPYVNAVLEYMAYFEKQSNATPTVIPAAPSVPWGSVQSSSLDDAHHSQPQSGGLAGGDTRRIVVDEKQKINLLAMASGKKWVTLIGVAMAAAGFLCSNQREGLNVLLSVAWAGKFCSIITFVGGIVAALGRGLADRRNPRADEPFGLAALPQNGENT